MKGQEKGQEEKVPERKDPNDPGNLSDEELEARREKQEKFEKHISELKDIIESSILGEEGASPQRKNAQLKSLKNALDSVVRGKKVEGRSLNGPASDAYEDILHYAKKVEKEEIREELLNKKAGLLAYYFDHSKEKEEGEKLEQAIEKVKDEENKLKNKLHENRDEFIHSVFKTYALVDKNNNIQDAGIYEDIGTKYQQFLNGTLPIHSLEELSKEFHLKDGGMRVRDEFYGYLEQAKKAFDEAYDVGSEYTPKPESIKKAWEQLNDKNNGLLDNLDYEVNETFFRRQALGLNKTFKDIVSLGECVAGVKIRDISQSLEQNVKLKKNYNNKLEENTDTFNTEDKKNKTSLSEINEYLEARLAELEAEKKELLARKTNASNTEKEAKKEEGNELTGDLLRITAGLFALAFCSLFIPFGGVALTNAIVNTGAVALLATAAQKVANWAKPGGFLSKTTKDFKKGPGGLDEKIATVDSVTTHNQYLSNGINQVLNIKHIDGRDPKATLERITSLLDGLDKGSKARLGILEKGNIAHFAPVFMKESENLHKMLDRYNNMELKDTPTGRELRESQRKVDGSTSMNRDTAALAQAILDTEGKNAAEALKRQLRIAAAAKGKTGKQKPLVNERSEEEEEKGSSYRL